MPAERNHAEVQYFATKGSICRTFKNCKFQAVEQCKMLELHQSLHHAFSLMLNQKNNQVLPWLRQVFIATVCLVLSTSYVLAETASVKTRYGVIHARPQQDAERSEIWFGGKAIANLNGDVSLYRLSVGGDGEYVLSDAFVPGLNCHHEFTLFEISSPSKVIASKNIGECKELFGARRSGNKVIVQLRDVVSNMSRNLKLVHEFAVYEGNVSELPEVLTHCQARAIGARSFDSNVRVNDRRQVVKGTGRAYFYSAPDDLCREPTFVVPGDIVSVRHDFDEFSDVEYRNTQNGRTFSGWLKRDRLQSSPR